MRKKILKMFGIIILVICAICPMTLAEGESISNDVPTGINKRTDENKYTSTTGHRTNELDKNDQKEIAERIANKQLRCSHEDVIQNQFLYMIDFKELPYKYREININTLTDPELLEERRKRALLDATILLTEINLAPMEVVLSQIYVQSEILNTGFKTYHDEDAEFERNIPLITSTKYNFTGDTSQVATSRMLALYDQKLSNQTLSAGEAYILSWEKEEKSDIDGVQAALYYFQEWSKHRDVANGFENIFDYFESVKNNNLDYFRPGNKSSDPLGETLAEEAIAIQKYTEAKEEIMKQDLIKKGVNQDWDKGRLKNGNLIIDNMTEEQYKNRQAGVVGYRELTHEFIIGPFSIDYARSVLPNITEDNTETEKRTKYPEKIFGVGRNRVFGTIIGAHLWGIDEESNEKEITEWQFIYPDVKLDEETKKTRRTAFGDDDWDICDYPLPGEVFYIKIKDDNKLAAITKLQFDMRSLNADGEVDILSGDWIAIKWRGVSTSAGAKSLQYAGHSSSTATRLYKLNNVRFYEEVFSNTSIELGTKRDGYDLYSGKCIPLTMDICGTVWLDGTERDEADLPKEEKSDKEYENQDAQIEQDMGMDVRKTIDGRLDNDEKKNKGIENVTVRIFVYKEGATYTAGTEVGIDVTDKNGQYTIPYIRVGRKYNIQFEYDGVKYKNTYHLIDAEMDPNNYFYSQENTAMIEDLRTYADNPWNYMGNSPENREPVKELEVSLAGETEYDRFWFNNQFYEMSEDKGTNLYPGEKNGQEIDLVYETGDKLNGQMSTLKEEKGKGKEPQKTSDTLTFRLVYPLHETYFVTEHDANSLKNGKSNTNINDKNNNHGLVIGTPINQISYNKVTDMTIVEEEENDGPGTAQTQLEATVSKETEYASPTFTKIYEYIRHINLGLIEREGTDLAVNTDMEETIFTLNESVAPSQIAGFGGKSNGKNTNFKLGNRVYGNIKYSQEINEDMYDWRVYNVNTGFAGYEGTEILENDELQMYVKYKMTIKNQSKLNRTYVTELTTYYTNDLYFPTNYNNAIWQYYDEEIQFLGTNEVVGYGSITIKRIMNYGSWGIKNNNTGDRINIGKIEWEADEEYQSESMKKMRTSENSWDLKSLYLDPGDSLDVYMIFKVVRNGEKGSKYIAIEGDKFIVTEVSKYQARNFNFKERHNEEDVEARYNGTTGARLDIDSNPGNCEKSSWTTADFKKFEDDTDASPFLSLSKTDKYGQSISGIVFEDKEEEIVHEDGTVEEKKSQPEMFNGKRDLMDKYEPGVPNITAELVRLEYDKEAEQYREVRFDEAYKELYESKHGKDGKVWYEDGKLVTRTDEDGVYEFTGLIPSGKYKVKFVYGTEYQMEQDDIKFNGQDYRTTTIEGMSNILQQDEKDPAVSVIAPGKKLTKCKVDILYDDPDEFTNGEAYRAGINRFVTKLKADLEKTWIQSGNVNEIKVDSKSVKMANIASEIDTTASNLIASSGYPSKILIIVTDGIIDRQDVLINKVKVLREAGVQVMVLGLEGAKLAPFHDDYIQYYNFTEERYETGIDSSEDTEDNGMSQLVYNLILNDIIMKSILAPQISHASDYLFSENGYDISPNREELLEVMPEHRLSATEVFGRINAMVASQYQDDELTSLLNDIRGNASKDYQREELVKLTQVTAQSHEAMLLMNRKENDIEINMGLQTIPKSKVEIDDKVNNIKITLSDGEEIINLNLGRINNLQQLKDKYIAYMDEEILTGANVEVEYAITLNNVGEKDNVFNNTEDYTLMEQIKAFEVLYRKEMGDDVVSNSFGDTTNEGEVFAKLKETTPVRVKAINNYFDTLTLREEENSVNTIIDNSKITDDLKLINQTSLWRSLPVTWSEADRRTAGILDTTWRAINTYNDNTKGFAKWQIAQTRSLSKLDIYPEDEEATAEDKEKHNQETTYIVLKATTDANDLEVKDLLYYNNSVEIIEVYNALGRRNYVYESYEYKDDSTGSNIDKEVRIYGNYNPVTRQLNEGDNAEAEAVNLLPPFGLKDIIHIALIVTPIIILVAGIVFIKKKIV